MYKKSTGPTTPSVSSSKKNPRGLGQPAQLDRKNDTHSNDFKSKDEQLMAMVKEYLQLNGYIRAHEILKN